LLLKGKQKNKKNHAQHGACFIFAGQELRDQRSYPRHKKRARVRARAKILALFPIAGIFQISYFNFHTLTAAFCMGVR
jgi:hypothetical protein